MTLVLRGALLLLWTSLCLVPVMARGGGGCFLAGTPVLMEDGTQKAIEAVRPGDRVLALLDGRVVPAVVGQTFIRTVEGYYELTAGTLLKVTGEHPFALAAGGFRNAEALHVGDALLARQADSVIPVPVTALNRVAGLVTVYNLEVEGPHTYFVSNIAVHNKGGFGGGHGGGFHSSGGSGFGGYHGGYGGGSGEPLDGWTVFWAVVIIGSIGGFILWDSWLTNRTQTDGPLRSNKLDFRVDGVSARQKHDEMQSLLQEQAGHDGRFDPGSLESQFKITFRMLQECWAERDYTPLEGRLTEKLMTQHQNQLDGLRRAHEVNRLAGLEILGCWFFRVQIIEYAEVTVLFEAKAKDYYVDDRDGRFLRGDSYPETFQEFWTFRLKADVWQLASIDQVTDASKAWSPSKVALSDGRDFESLDSVGQLEKRMRTLAAERPWWDPLALKEHLSVWASGIAAARESASLSPLSPEDFAPKPWGQLSNEIAFRTERGEQILLRNFCVREVRPLLVRPAKAKQSQDEAIFTVSTHAQTEVRHGQRLVSLEPAIRIVDEHWTVVYEGHWKVKAIERT